MLRLNGCNGQERVGYIQKTAEANDGWQGTWKSCCSSNLLCFQGHPWLFFIFFCWFWLLNHTIQYVFPWKIILLVLWSSSKLHVDVSNVYLKFRIFIIVIPSAYPIGVCLSKKKKKRIFNFFHINTDQIEQSNCCWRYKKKKKEIRNNKRWRKSEKKKRSFLLPTTVAAFLCKKKNQSFIV